VPHAKRVDFYKEVAVQGVLQGIEGQAEPLATGSRLLEEAVDHIDERRAQNGEAPILFPEVRKDKDGNIALFPAQLPEELYWPAEFAFGRPDSDEERSDCSIQTQGFSRDSESALLEWSQFDMVNNLCPWLRRVAENAGIREPVVKAAPCKPFVLGIDRENGVLHLNPAFLPIIVAAASNHNRHIPSQAFSTPNGPADSNQGRNGVRSESSGVRQVSKDALSVEPDKAPSDEVLSRYHEFAWYNPPELPEAPGGHVQMLRSHGGNNYCICACNPPGCDEWGCSADCDGCSCKGCSCDCNKEKGEEPTIDLECSATSQGRWGQGLTATFLTLPAFVFLWWRRKERP
jgi:hypothetical protein